MTLALDSYFCMGKTHKICQDYALHNGEYLIVSDGCSTAPNSDFGSRLLSRAAAQCIDLLKDPYLNTPEEVHCFLSTSIYNATTFSRSLNLPLDSLAATLLVAKRIEDRINVYISGDGVIIHKDLNGTITIIEVTFESNAPYYLKYKISGEVEYLEKFPPNITIKKTIADNLKTLAEKTMTIVSSDSKLDSEYYWTDYCFNLKETEYIGISSDGLMDFIEITTKDTDIVGKILPASVIIPELTNFKSYNGEFVYRRCHKMFKEFDKKKWYNRDDFSIGVMANVN